MNLILKENSSLENRENLLNLFQRFIDYIDASPKSIETYTRALKQFFIYLVEEDIKQPQRGNILAYRDSLKTYCKASTIQSYIGVVRRFFEWTEQEGLYPNVAKNIKSAKTGREHKKDALTSTQTKDIITHLAADRKLKGLRDYAIFVLAVTGGLRTIALQRADIKDLRPLGDNTVLYIQGKGRDDKTEYVKITAPVEKAIRKYLKERKESNEKAPLFGSISNRNNGGRMSTRSFSRIIKTAMVGNGYNSDRLTAHSLRHTAGTLNLLNGGTLEETQKFLRHSNINTTMTYLHHLDRENNKSEERIANAIF